MHRILCSVLWVALVSPFAWADWPPALKNAEAWESLPAADMGANSPLPQWARILAKTLPHTTAALLELEYTYRTEPLELKDKTDGSVLAAIARFSVAEFHQSAYGKAVAQSDLKRLGAHDLATSLANSTQSLHPLQKEVYDFAKQLAELGKGITDEQYRSLQAQIGDEAMVGLVLRIAHGCFQDRLHWALGIPDAADANPEPIQIRFAESTPNGANTPSAERVDSEALLRSVDSDKLIVAPEKIASKFDDDLATRNQLQWGDYDFSSLQNSLESQRSRTARIAVPDWDAIAPKLPKDLYRRPLRIRWSRVVVGYQPKLGPAWIKCLRVFEQEAHQNRVFEESVFWVVTRGLKCFYCMGHCEMLMEVGGLSSGGIAHRTGRISSGDWSSFSPGEQAAFAFAKKLTEAPTTITQQDRDRLVETLGETRALDLLWWASRCQFMTKVSDSFQLQLERENVFAD